MSIAKKYFKSKPVCRATFTFVADAAQSVCVVGDFNNWDASATPMKHCGKSQFKAVVDLKPGQEYHFRYFIDNSRWENDGEADKYIPSPFGCENSVVTA